MTIVVTALMKLIVRCAYQVQVAVPINSLAVQTTYAFQEATTVIWRETVLMAVMKLVAVSVFTILCF